MHLLRAYCFAPQRPLPLPSPPPRAPSLSPHPRILAGTLVCRPNHPRQCPDVDAFTGCVSLRRTARRHAAGRTLSPPLPVHRPGRRTHRDRSVCGGAPPHRSLTASPSYMCQPLEELPTQRPSQDSSFPLRLTPHRPLAPHRWRTSPAPISPAPISLSPSLPLSPSVSLPLTLTLPPPVSLPPPLPPCSPAWGTSIRQLRFLSPLGMPLTNMILKHV